MEDIWIPKQLFYRDLQHIHDINQENVFRVSTKKLRAFRINIREQMIVYRSTLKKIIYDDYKKFKARGIKHSNMKRALWKEDLTSVNETL